jgi:hypothetical protein
MPKFQKFSGAMHFQMHVHMHASRSRRRAK